MQANIRQLLVAVAVAGWIGIFAEAAGMFPWRPHIAVHIALVAAVACFTIVAALVAYAEARFKGATHYAAMRVGEAFAAERSKATN